MIERPNFREIAARSALDLSDQHARVQRRDLQFSLADMIAERIGSPYGSPHSIGQATERSYELSEACRMSSGHAPSGMWVPLAHFARDLSSTSDAGLGSLAASGVMAGSQLQQSVSKKSAIFAGATVLTGLLGGEMDFLGIGTDVAVTDAWQSEIAAGPVKEPVFKAITLAPKQIRITLTISRAVLLNRSVDLENGLNQYFLARFLEAIDSAAIQGDGVNQPAGLLGNADLSVLSAGTNGLAPTWAHMVELEYDAASRAGDMTRPAFITSPKLRKKLRTTARGAGLDVILPGPGDELLGNPLRASTNVPDTLVKGSSGAACSAMIYGDLAELIVGFFGPAAMDFMVDPVTRAADGLVKIVASASVGIAPRNVKAFSAYKDLLSA